MDGNNKRAAKNFIIKPDYHIIFFYEGALNIGPPFANTYDKLLFCMMYGKNESDQLMKRFKDVTIVERCM